MYNPNAYVQKSDAPSHKNTQVSLRPGAGHWLARCASSFDPALSLFFNLKNAGRLVLAGGCLSFALQATAQESIPEQLQRINESIAVLNAKRQELELRAQVVAKQSEIDRLINGDANTNSRLQPPSVQSIEGADGKMVATLMMSSGQTQTVKKGDKIPGGWTVAQVGVDAVHISRGREKLRLAYGYQPPPAQAITSVPPLSPRGQ